MFLWGAPLNTKLNQAIQFLSQCGHNAVVKVNLKTIGQEKNSADLLLVFVQQTLGHCLDTAGVTGSNPVAPTIKLKKFIL